VTHSLKTLTGYFEKVLSGEKTFEVRRDDRAFHVGDTLKLMEWEYRNGKYAFSERAVHVTVTYILPGGQYGVERGYVVMGIKVQE